MSMSLTILILVTGANVSLYTGHRTWDDGNRALAAFCAVAGHACTAVDAGFINSGGLGDSTDVLIIPGGWAARYRQDIDSAGCENIRGFVSAGGVYVGFCAGAFFACDNVVWEGRTWPYYLDLFAGEGIGAIAEIAPWPDYAMAECRMDVTHPALVRADSVEWVLYYGGPWFRSLSAACDTLATYAATGEPAIVAFGYGSGRVVLSGPHPEIEEDDDRDSTDFAEELDDRGSDWVWLADIIDWALSSAGAAENGPEGNGLKSRPPAATIAHGVLYVACGRDRPGDDPVGLLDINGRRVMELRPGGNPIGHLGSGVYFVCRDDGTGAKAGPAERPVVHKVVVRR